MGLKGRAVPPSGFGHGSEACEEGLLRERMRRRIECMCKEKGGELFMELRCRWVSEVEDKKRGCKFPGLRNEKHGCQKLNWLKG